jgi:hypothetical protein
MDIRFTRLRAGETDHERLWAAVISASLLAAAAWLRAFGLPPLVCPFHALTGLPCPTCGVTRALAALVAGNLGASLRLHPAVLPGVALAAAYAAYAWLVVGLRLPRLRVSLAPRESRALRWSAAAVLVGVWSFLIAGRT